MRRGKKKSHPSTFPSFIVFSSVLSITNYSKNIRFYECVLFYNSTKSNRRLFDSLFEIFEWHCVTSLRAHKMSSNEHACIFYATRVFFFQRFGYI